MTSRGTLLALIALAACGGGDPDEIVDCDDPMTWGKVGDEFVMKCARACAGGPSGEVDADGDGFSDACPRGEGTGCPVNVTARFDGDAYCCAPTSPGPGEEATWTVDEGGCP